MKVNKPAQEVHVCDFCRRDGYVVVCWVCGRDYCLTCDGTVCGSYGFAALCRECACRDDVQAVCDEYANKLKPVFAARDAALKALGRATQ